MRDKTFAEQLRDITTTIESLQKKETLTDEEKVRLDSLRHQKIALERKVGKSSGVLLFNDINPYTKNPYEGRKFFNNWPLRKQQRIDRGHK